MEDLLVYLHFVVLPQMIDALVIGVALAVVALGLTMIFGLLDVINLAHGDLYMLGGYAAFTLDDARRSGERLLKGGPARVKPSRACWLFEITAMERIAGKLAGQPVIVEAGLAELVTALLADSAAIAVGE